MCERAEKLKTLNMLLHIFHSNPHDLSSQVRNEASTFITS